MAFITESDIGNVITDEEVIKRRTDIVTHSKAWEEHARKHKNAQVEAIRELPPNEKYHNPKVTAACNCGVQFHLSEDAKKGSEVYLKPAQEEVKQSGAYAKDDKSSGYAR